MMIYKQFLMSDIETVQIIALPKDAVVISAGIQNNRLCIWYHFNPRDTAILEDRYFIVMFTGQEINIDIKKFIGTVMLEANTVEFPYIVMHVFEVEST